MEKSCYMLLHIALVSITKEVTLAQLAPVSAAIQKQVSRDFGPMWNVEATVDAFDKLEDVPVGYGTCCCKTSCQAAPRVCTSATTTSNPSPWWP